MYPKEQKVIENSPAPRTRQSIADDLRRLGVQAGMVLLVHSSMSKMGWVNGGAVAVIQALQDVLTADGTLVMPTFTSAYSDPAPWENPPIPVEWHQHVRETMPAYDPRLAPTRGMGCIPELFRTWPDVERSSHPHLSFAAWGKRKREIIANHGLAFSLGERSPLARLYDAGAYVLLLGVGYGNNSSFHLAEYRAPGMKRELCGAPLLANGRQQWTTFEDVALDEEDFPQIGEAFEQAQSIATGLVGSAHSKLFSQPTAVDFAERWMAAHRKTETQPPKDSAAN